MAVNASELTREIEELIAALDRRVQRVERAGEAAIARDAAALRAKAFDRWRNSPPIPVGSKPDSGDPLRDHGSRCEELRSRRVHVTWWR